MRAWMAVLVMAAAACAAAPEPHGAAGPLPADTGVVERVGTVRVVGSSPVDTRVVLQEEGGRQLVVHGALAPEIARLGGVELAVAGRVQDGGIEASAYRVRSVHGAPAIVGMVESAPGGGLQIRTEEGEVIRITGADAHLRVGQKVWVQGASTLQVQSYGVITP